MHMSWKTSIAKNLLITISNSSSSMESTKKFISKNKFTLTFNQLFKKIFWDSLPTFKVKSNTSTNSMIESRRALILILYKNSLNVKTLKMMPIKKNSSNSSPLSKSSTTRNWVTYFSKWKATSKDFKNLRFSSTFTSSSISANCQTTKRISVSKRF